MLLSVFIAIGTLMSFSSCSKGDDLNETNDARQISNIHATGTRSGGIEGEIADVEVEEDEGEDGPASAIKPVTM